MQSEDSFAGMVDSTGTPLTKMPDFVRSGTNGFLLNDSGEVLMQRRADNGYWGLPGGGVDVGESVEQGAVREVLEETGLHVTAGRLIGIYSDPKHYTIMSYPQGRVIQYVIMLFECTYVSGKLAVSHESTEIGYFPPDALPENTLLSHRIRIQDALAGQAAPFIR